MAWPITVGTGTVYTYAMSINSQGTVTFTTTAPGMPPGGWLVNTGGTHFEESASYCGKYDFTDYEEIWQITEAQSTPSWSYWFNNNKVDGQPFAAWNPFTAGNNVPGAVREALGGANTAVFNQFFSVTMSPLTRYVTYGTRQITGWGGTVTRVYDPLDCLWNSCQVGLSFTLLPSGWSGSFSTGGVPTFSFTATVNIPANAPIGTYYLDVQALNTLRNQYTTVRITVVIQSGGCVASDTPILTDHGYVPVQKLKPGDTVMEYDFATQTMVAGTLLYANWTWEDQMVDINSGTLRLTLTDQPIYVKTATTVGWLRDPQNLMEGDSIFDAVNTVWVPVTSVQIVQDHVRVYDVVTSGANNFIANGMLLDRKCVVKGTLILTPDGYVPVQDLKPGDILMSYDFASGTLVQSHLLYLNVSKERDVVDVNDGALEVTAGDQPIYITNATFTGWITNPRDLKVGDSIFDPVNSAWIPVTSVQVVHLRHAIEVYAVEADGPNNFIANGMLL